VSVVRGGLNNPRHLTLNQNGLWVAQAGAGGPAGSSNCVTGPSIGGSGTTRFCVGRTGAVSLIRHGHITASVRLPSVIEADNNKVAGPAAVAFSHGRAAVVMQDLLVNSQGGNALWTAYPDGEWEPSSADAGSDFCAAGGGGGAAAVRAHRAVPGTTQGLAVKDTYKETARGGLALNIVEC
jgi:hypothetical protein